MDLYILDTDYMRATNVRTGRRLTKLLENGKEGGGNYNKNTDRESDETFSQMPWDKSCLLGNRPQTQVSQRKFTLVGSGLVVLGCSQYKLSPMFNFLLM